MFAEKDALKAAAGDTGQRHERYTSEARELVASHKLYTYYSEPEKLRKLAFDQAYGHILLGLLLLYSNPKTDYSGRAAMRHIFESKAITRPPPWLQNPFKIKRYDFLDEVIEHYKWEKSEDAVKIVETAEHVRHMITNERVAFMRYVKGDTSCPWPTG
jgi:hypothetical protein